MYLSPEGCREATAGPPSSFSFFLGPAQMAAVSAATVPQRALLREPSGMGQELSGLCHLQLLEPVGESRKAEAIGSHGSSSAHFPPSPAGRCKGGDDSWKSSSRMVPRTEKSQPADLSSCLPCSPLLCWSCQVVQYMLL